MKKRKKHQKTTENLRLQPEERVTPKFDDRSIAAFRLPEEGEMGFRVVDNITEENIR